MYFIFYSKRFDRSLNRLVTAKRIRREEIHFVLKIIASRKVLDKKYYDHQLGGNMQEYRECHVRNDILLQYKLMKNELTVVAIDVGSHSDIFG